MSFHSSQLVKEEEEEEEEEEGTTQSYKANWKPENGTEKRKQSR